jgi:hypothetical protein
VFLHAVLALAVTLADGPAPSPAPSSASPSAAATPVPAPTPSPPPTPVPTPVPTPSPFAYVLTPPPPAAGNPAIYEVDLTDRTVRTGKPFTIIVSADPAVTTVTLSLDAFGQRFNLYVMGGGRFGATWSAVPQAPASFLDRDYALSVTASYPDGRHTSFPITVRLAR